MLKGYAPYIAKIRYIVAWKGEGDECENAVLLPDIHYIRVWIAEILNRHF